MNNVYSELLPWFQQLPGWQNEAFRRLLTRPRLLETDMEEIYAAACAELGIAAERQAPPLRLTADELPVGTVAESSKGRLVSIHSLANVNRLAAGHRLEFGPQLTIVYGSNGSGKSGYARVLKKACRCNERAVEKILSNVYETVTAGAASAILEIESAGVPRTVVWQETVTPDPELRKYAVFDSKAARSYLRERNVLPLTPTVFVQLEFFGDAVRQIKERFLSAAASEQPLSTALAAFTDQSKCGQMIAGISAATDREKLSSSLCWTEADQTLLADKELQLATLKTKGPAALRKELQQRRTRLVTLASKLRQAECLVAPAVVDAIKESSRRVRSLTEQKKAAARLALGGSELAGVGSAAWEAMLRGAVAFFSETEAETVFPGPAGASRCVLCQQFLSPPSHQRLQQFWAFLQNDTAKKLESEEKRLKGLLAPLEQASDNLPPEICVLKEQLATDAPAIWERVPAYFAALCSRRNSILKAVSTGEWSQTVAPVDAISTDCDEEIEALVQKEKDLGDATLAVQELKEREEAVTELLSRKRAHANRESILAHHQKLLKSAALRAAADSISTLGISNKNSALQKKHLLEAFSNQVKELAKEFGLRRAIPGITSRTEAGRVSQTVVVHGARSASVPAEAVFSEGERTALALAYFLAELGTASDTFGLVFDDPVTSLDHRIRTKVAEKIACLAKTRQAVVFTHDLAFFCELKDAATRTGVGVELRSIEAVGGSVGLVRAGEPWDAMGVSEREQVLEELLRAAKAAEGGANAAEYASLCCQFYGRLRSTWERAVEELIFNKVVLRFDKSVKTQSLTGVVVDAAVIADVFAAMTKCSGLIDGHDHAAAANTALPDSDELRADLEGIRSFRGAQKKRREAQTKLLAHLK